MKLISVNVAQARDVEYKGRVVRSGIWKQAVNGPVEVGETNLAGDRQANLIFHGGLHKAAYAFSHDHYAWWKRELQRDDLLPGMFGENLTISGLNERNSCLGDQWQVGSVRFGITGPRIPCSNLAMKFNDKTVPNRFTKAGLPGVYLRVLQTGVLTAGDVVDELADPEGLSIYELFHAYNHPRDAQSPGILQSALAHPLIDPGLIKMINKRLNTTEASNA